MKRWLPLLCLLLLLAGCGFFERKPVGDGTMAQSDAEVAADVAADVASTLGFGWIGLLLQGASVAASTIATRRT